MENWCGCSVCVFWLGSCMQESDWFCYLLITIESDILCVADNNDMFKGVWDFLFVLISFFASNHFSCEISIIIVKKYGLKSSLTRNEVPNPLLYINHLKYNISFQKYSNEWQSSHYPCIMSKIVNNFWIISTLTVNYLEWPYTRLNYYCYINLFNNDDNDADDVWPVLLWIHRFY